MKLDFKKTWAEENPTLRFECQETGKCCVMKEDEGYIYFTQSDIERLARHLEMPIDALKTRDFDADPDNNTGLFCLKSHRGQCQYLRGSKCGVYEGRPEQCRLWPFWPSNMNAKSWKQMASFCPGIGKGKSVEWQKIPVSKEMQLLRINADVKLST